MALLTAEAVEKIRVNPGNFADGAKKFTVINYENEVRPPFSLAPSVLSFG